MSTESSAENLHDKLLDHDFDGIQEYDNRLPNWWLWTLHLAIIFSFVYWFAFRWLKDYPTSEQMLAAQFKQIEEQAAASTKPLSDEQLWAMVSNEAMVAQGHDVFMQNCAACHGDDLQGGPGGGPSLVDETWIHGGTPEVVARTVREGISDKGMPTWKDLISSAKINAVVAFVMSHHPKPDARAVREEPTTQSEKLNLSP